MRSLFCVVILFISCSPSKYYQVGTGNLSDKIFLENNNFYIVCRGTYSKSALIAEKFNLHDRNITHCGIGFFVGSSFIIYNVADNNQSKLSALFIDSFNSFSKSSDIYYVSIWKYRVNRFALAQIRKSCEHYFQRKISFDFNFNINENDNVLYCSEFCYRILKELRCRKLNFKPTQITLNNELYESLLNRKTLTYFPVDFFETNKKFKKVYEWKSLK